MFIAACRWCTGSISYTSVRIKSSARSRPLLTRRPGVRSVSTLLHGSRSPTWFFSPNISATGITTIPPDITRNRLEWWGGRADAIPRHPQSSPDAPSLSIPLPLVEYPPLPLSAYKPIARLTPGKALRIYVQLSKARLTSLVTLTAMAGVAMSPIPPTIPVLLSTALGTMLCIASANTINQLFEAPFDAQMIRTRTRPLVRRAISPLHAFSFAGITGVSGPAILYTIVNPTTALLGAANIVLYAGVYTTLKRQTTWNTWVGAVVGGIPPLMGWTAGGGHLLPAAYSFEPFLPSFLNAASSIPPPLEAIDNPLSVLALFAVLFSWQFPHFNSLSYLSRACYAQAGYHMLSVTNPSKNALVSLRHAVLLIPICSVLVPLSGLTTWWFALSSLLPNAIALRAAWQYWKKGTDKYARKVFHHSLWYLPVVLGLMMFHKQGMEWLRWLGWKPILIEERIDPISDAEKAGGQNP